MPHTINPTDWIIDTGFRGVPPEEHWILLVLSTLPLLISYFG